MALCPAKPTQTYYGRRYLSLPRMVTHWHQAQEVARVTPEGGHVLEVGPGSGHTTWLLQRWGYAVTTLDIDPRLEPDLLGDVTAIPAEDDAFDCVLAAEILEHLPFDRFEPALRELGRVARRGVVVSLPAPFVGISALVNLPRLWPKSLYCGVPQCFIPHRFNGEHYWELGKRGYSVRRIRRSFAAAGLTIAKSYRPAPSLNCYFFIANV